MPTNEQFDRAERLIIGLYFFIPLMFILKNIL